MICRKMLTHYVGEPGDFFMIALSMDCSFITICDVIKSPNVIDWLLS